MGEVFQEYSEKNHPELPALTIIQGGGTVLREESERKLQYDKSSLAGYKMVREDDFIVHLRSFEGGLEKSNHNGLISPAYHTFHGDEVDSRFYYPYFRSYEFIKHKLVPHVYGIRDGRSIDIDGMKTIEIPWTLYEEQKKIGDYIESLDTLITLHQRKLFLNFVKKNDWEQRKVSELSEKTFGGGTPKTSNDSFWKGNIPWIQSSDLVEGSLFDVEPRKYISQEAVDKSATKLVPEKSVAIVTRVGVGKLAFMPFSYATSQDFLSLSVLKTEPQFTVYALYKKLQSELNDVQGTSIKGVTKDELLAKEVMIPCYKEQEKIGSYLHSLDHLITLHQRKCDETKKLKKFMLQKMFPKKDAKKPEIRFAGFTDDWEQRKFGSLLEETRNKTTVEDEDTLLSCAIDGMYLNSELFSHFRGSSNIGYLKVKKNDLILSAQNLHLGNCNVNLRFEHGIISPAYKVYELVGCNPLFMQAWVKKDSTKDFFLKASTEGASVCRKNIVWEELYKQELPVPSIEEQTKVGEYFNSLDHLITLHQRKCDELKEFKKYMLQNMFPQKG